MLLNHLHKKDKLIILAITVITMQNYLLSYVNLPFLLLFEKVEIRVKTSTQKRGILWNDNREIESEFKLLCCSKQL